MSRFPLFSCCAGALTTLRNLAATPVTYVQGLQPAVDVTYKDITYNTTVAQHNVTVYPRYLRVAAQGFTVSDITYVSGAAISSITGDSIQRSVDGATTISCRVVNEEIGYDEELTFTIPADSSYSAFTPVNVFVNWVSGSLAEHVTAQMAAATAGKTAADRPIFSTYTSGSLIRNMASPITAFNGYTGLSPWNSYGGQFRAGTLITSQHIWFALHYPMPIGTVVTFVAADNTVVTRTIVSSAVVTGDAMIAKLDSPVPGTITPCKMLAANHTSYLPTMNVQIINGNSPIGKIPAFATNQNELGSIGALTAVTADSSVIYGDHPNYAGWMHSLISGDSGSPILIPINGDLVALACYTGPGGGQHLTAEQAQATVNLLGGGQTILTPSMTEFPAY